MALQIVDFTRNRNAGGKFVVLVKQDDPDERILLVSDFSRDAQHADIVRRWERTRDCTLAAAGFRTAGGGWWKMAGASAVELSGRSAAYGRFDPEWLQNALRPGDLFGAAEIIFTNL